MKQKNQHVHADPDAAQFYALPNTKTSPAQKLTVSSPEDVLAYIQCTLGFRPRNSLVAVAFSGNQLSTVARCDLPGALQHMLRSDTPESVTFWDFGLTEPQELQLIDIGRHMGKLIAKEPSTTSCMLLYLSDDVSVGDQQALSVAGMANSIIAAQFGLQRVSVEEAWFIHHSLLWHLRCASTLECAVQRETVADPEQTDIFRSLDPQGDTTQQESATVRRLVFPPVPLPAARQLPDTQQLLEKQPKVVVDWLKLWDGQLANGPQMLDSAQVAEFLTSLEHTRVRDAVLALACFDFTTALRGMVTLGQFPSQVATAAGLSTNSSDGIHVRDCMRGQSERAPDWHRVHELERLCHQLLPLSDAGSGGAITAILVWIEWARGRGSIAATYVKQARKRFPTNHLLVMLENFLRQGLVSGWAMRTDSAWSAQHAA